MRDPLAQRNHNSKFLKKFIIILITGYAAFRHIHEGSYFIKAFLSVAENKYRDEHIEEILTLVRNKLATDPEYAPHSREGKCQMAVIESTSTKKFYL